MRSIVLDTMKYSLILVLCCTMVVQGTAQVKYERAFRILKKQFPQKALQTISGELEEARKIRYYKEMDSTGITYEVQFKRDRLRYGVAFNAEGTLKEIEIDVKQVDLPDASWQHIQNYLTRTFKKVRVRKMRQQYPVIGSESQEQTLKNAFQNLLLPSINYALMVSGKKTRGHERYELLFDAEGNFRNIRKSPPPNYDHVLY